MDTHTHTRMFQIYTYTSMHTEIYIHTHTHTYIYIYISISIYKHKHRPAESTRGVTSGNAGTSSFCVAAALIFPLATLITYRAMIYDDDSSSSIEVLNDEGVGDGVAEGEKEEGESEARM